jgi:hypothetical protein
MAAPTARLALALLHAQVVAVAVVSPSVAAMAAAFLVAVVSRVVVAFLEPVVHGPADRECNPDRPAGAVCQPYTHTLDECAGYLFTEDRRIIIL